MADLFAAQHLLDELRREFAGDPEGNLEKLVRHATGFSKDPRAAIHEILPICHNIKGSAQAVGFASLGEVVHALEDVLGAFAARADGAAIVKAVDALLQLTVDELTAHFRVLGQTLEDAPSEKLAALARELDDVVRGDVVPGDVVPGDVVPEGPASWGIFADMAPAQVASEPGPVAAPAPVTHAPSVGGPSCEPEPAAASATPAAGDDSQKYLLVEQASQFYAINLAHVREVIADHYLNPLPRVTPGVKGMIVVRDRALPVLDLGGLFAGAAADGREGLCAVICERNGQGFAFSVEKPHHVIDLAGVETERVAAQARRERGEVDLVQAVVDVAGRSVLIVDLEAVA